MERANIFQEMMNVMPRSQVIKNKNYPFPILKMID